MLDLLYVAGTLLFFALMLLYSSGCAALGRRREEDATEDRTS